MHSECSTYGVHVRVRHFAGSDFILKKGDNFHHFHAVLTSTVHTAVTVHKGAYSEKSVGVVSC